MQNINAGTWRSNDLEPGELPEQIITV